MPSQNILVLMTIALLVLSSCTANKSDRSLLPSSIDFSDPIQLNPEWIAGIYTDRWVSDESEIILGNPRHMSVLELEGTNVDDKSATKELQINVGSSGAVFYVVKVPSLGEFHEYIPLPLDVSTSDTLHLTLVPSKTFVPKEIGTSDDERVLSFRISRVSLVDEDMIGTIFPGSFEFPLPAETDPNLEGIYKDGWMGDSARITLHNTRGLKNLELKGYYPTNIFEKIADLEVYVGGKLLVKEQLSRKNRGYFRIYVQLPEEQSFSTKIQIVLKPSGSFVPSERGTSDDPRQISYRLQYIGLK